MVSLPRVGGEFQAEIPDLITGPEYRSYLNRPVIDTENKDHVPFDFLMGLSVPVTYIRNISNDVPKEKKDEMLDFSTQSIGSLSVLGSVTETIDPCCLVPGVRRDLWNDIEESSFLLGLYLFKKNFVELKKFIGSKKMGEILFFYYTQFYRSTGFNRWSSCSEGRKWKRAYGTWLFTGFRHQELLSRLLPQVSEESQKLLREVTEKYAKKDMSLTEYVFSIKSIVGLETFVNSVAIGKGNQDLTSMVLRPVRIPVGEACSNLEHAEIVKILTGGCRLTKVQSSDLFWEAVWPRLLARGWHSEQPKNRASLVFLPPCVEKFSRKLVKGNHYFESLTDVMSKVRSEPDLLQLDTCNDEAENKGLTEDTKEQQNLPKKRRFSLQTQSQICDMDAMKFTVTHTSLNNEKSVQSKKLKTLSSEMIIVSGHSEEDTGNPCGSTTRASQDDDSYDQENSRSNMFIDSNLPPKPVDGVLMTDLANVQDDITSTRQDAFCALQTSADKSAPEQPIQMSSRRQSSRNKLPTARALEALVNGDLTVKRRRKKNACAH